MYDLEERGQIAGWMAKTFFQVVHVAKVAEAKPLGGGGTGSFCKAGLVGEGWAGGDL